MKEFKIGTKENKSFDKWLKLNGWDWVVGLEMFFNKSNGEFKSKLGILMLYNASIPTK